jgi:hypothetical protein
MLNPHHYLLWTENGKVSDRAIDVPVGRVTQCDTIRSMTGNVTSSRTFLGAEYASNHPHKCDCLKLEIVTYLIQTGVTYVKKHSLCNNAVCIVLFSLITVIINGAGRGSVAAP